MQKFSQSSLVLLLLEIIEFSLSQTWQAKYYTKEEVRNLGVFSQIQVLYK